MIKYLCIILTIYHSCPEQCNEDYTTTASGYNIKNPENPEPILAISWDLDYCFGEWVLIECLDCDDCDYHNRIFQVQDCMDSRWKRRVDVLVPKSVKHGRYRVKLHRVPTEYKW